MSLNNGTISYSWLPETYGDYVLKYYLKNAIHVESELIINIKIAASTPPNIVLTTPI